MLSSNLVTADGKREDLKKVLTLEIKKVDKFALGCKVELNEFKDSLYYKKTCTPRALTEEEGLVQMYQKYILNE